MKVFETDEASCLCEIGTNSSGRRKEVAEVKNGKRLINEGVT